MAALKFVRSVWESFRATSGLEPRLLDGMRITAAQPGKVNFELPIEQQHTNRLQILHGGTLACMTDIGGSFAVASKGLFATGVSTDLNVTYLSSGGKVGDLLKAEVTCDKCEYEVLDTKYNVKLFTDTAISYEVGKNLAYTSIRFTNSKDQLVARGSHTKYVAIAFKEPKNILEELSPELIKDKSTK